MSAMMKPDRRPRLGLSLEDIMGVKRPVDGMAPDLGMGEPQKKRGFLAPGSKGAMIAGILGDALAVAGGGQAVTIPTMIAERRRGQDMAAEEAQWSRRREQMREDKQWEWQNKPREDAIPPILRDAQAWQNMTPEQRAAYGEMQKARAGDPDVTLTLPNGQLYVGPKSGIQAALGGANPRPVGRLTPIEGGPTPPASGGFRR